MSNKRKVRLCTKLEYEVLIWAPDGLDFIPAKIDMRTLKGLVTRRLIEINADKERPRWKITDYGLLMVEAYQRENKIQGVLKL
jgi:hypothetical protein